MSMVEARDSMLGIDFRVEIEHSTLRVTKEHSQLRAGNQYSQLRVE